MRPIHYSEFICKSRRFTLIIVVFYYTLRWGNGKVNIVTQASPLPLVSSFSISPSVFFKMPITSPSYSELVFLTIISYFQRKGRKVTSLFNCFNLLIYSENKQPNKTIQRFTLQKYSPSLSWINSVQLIKTLSNTKLTST